ncbi:unnamed protein product [Strongylus vulgaris]|uniref:Uncharacterized protein n=1 Tax=Strongylus vulgaris TaxID=40348 RepID=A0A3P7L1Q4_STRVU|nr:unnamed protein product [Strongylus vulgaris]
MRHCVKLMNCLDASVTERDYCQLRWKKRKKMRILTSMLTKVNLKLTSKMTVPVMTNRMMIVHRQCKMSQPQWPNCFVGVTTHLVIQKHGSISSLLPALITFLSTISFLHFTYQANSKLSLSHIYVLFSL